MPAEKAPATNAQLDQGLTDAVAEIDDGSFHPEHDAVWSEPAADEKGKAAPPAKAEKAKAAEPEKKPEVQAKPEKPKHDPYIVAQAKRFGATDEWIEEQTPAFLERRVHQAIARENVEPEKKAEKPEEPADDFWGEAEFEGVKRLVKDDDIHPAIVKVSRAFQKQLKELQDKIGAYEKRDADRHEAEREDGLEAAVADLQKSRPGFFGDKPTSKLSRDSIEFKRLQAAWRTADVKPEDSGKTVAKKMREAAEFLFGDAMLGKRLAIEDDGDEAARDEQPRDAKTGQFIRTAEAEAEVEKWRNNGQPAATNRVAPAKKLTGDAAAVKAIEDKFRSLGLAPNGQSR